MCDFLADILPDVASGVLSTLVAAAILLLVYAHQRAAKLRNAILAIHHRMLGLVEGESVGDKERHAELMELLDILLRETARVDENVLSLQIAKELELKRIHRRTASWRSRLDRPPVEVIQLIVKIRLDSEASEYSEFREYLNSLPRFAKGVNVWAFFER